MDSIIESGYIVASDGSLRKQLGQVSSFMVPCIVDPILKYWDNDGAIAKAKRTTVSSKV